MSWDEIRKAVNSDLKTPLNEGGVKIVKSVQSGYVDKKLNPYNSTTTVAINKIDPNKTAIFIENARVANDIGSSPSSESIVNYGYIDTLFLSEIKSDTLIFCTKNLNYNNYTRIAGRWIAVEFY